MNYPPYPFFGKLKQEVTSITLANNTEKKQKHTCPTGKRQLILNVKMTNPDNVTREFAVEKWVEAAETSLIKYMVVRDILAGEVLNWPGYPFWDLAGTDTTAAWTATMEHGDNQAQALPVFPEILEEGNTLSCRYKAGGASAGGTDADGLVIELLEVDV